MKILAPIVFIIAQIVFVPLAIIGVILVTYKQLFLSKKLGVSQTAVEVINGRWAMDRFDIRSVLPSVKLAAALPNNSIVGM